MQKYTAKLARSYDFFGLCKPASSPIVLTAQTDSFSNRRIGWPTVHAKPDPRSKGSCGGTLSLRLYKHAPAALGNPKLSELLSLANALREGQVQEKKLAMELLKEKISNHSIRAWQNN